jgi:hypothetical protein
MNFQTPSRRHRAVAVGVKLTAGRGVGPGGGRESEGPGALGEVVTGAGCASFPLRRFSCQRRSRRKSSRSANSTVVARVTPRQSRRELDPPRIFLQFLGRGHGDIDFDLHPCLAGSENQGADLRGYECVAGTACFAQSATVLSKTCRNVVGDGESCAQAACDPIADLCDATTLKCAPRMFYVPPANIGGISFCYFGFACSPNDFVEAQLACP